MPQLITIDDSFYPGLQGYEGNVIKTTDNGMWITILDTCQADKRTGQIIEWIGILTAYGIAESILKAFFYVCWKPRVSLFISHSDLQEGRAVLYNE